MYISGKKTVLKSLTKYTEGNESINSLFEQKAIFELDDFR